jgi:hypothetical protein
MPLPRLPDISIDSWIRDQQQKFENQISGLASAFEFKDAVGDVESTLPPDFPNPGGTDQWQEAEAKQREEYYRQQQEDDERRKQQEQDAENQQQREAYLNERMKQETRQQQEAQRAQMLQETQAAGIPSPDQALSDFQAVEKNPGDVRSFQQFADTMQQGGVPDPDLLMKQPVSEDSGVRAALPPTPAPTSAPSPDPSAASSADQSSLPYDARQYDEGPREQPYPGTVSPIINPDQSVTTERSITVTDPDLNNGKPTNIPTVWSGKVVSDDEAIQNAIDSKRDFPTFDTVDEADQAAVQRSSDIGAGKINSLVGGGQGPVPGLHASGVPDPDTLTPPAEQSGLLSRASAAFQSAGNQISDAAQAVQDNPLYQTTISGGLVPDVIGITRRGIEGSNYAVANYGAGKGMQNEARTRELSDEMLSNMQQRGETPSLRDTMGAGEIDPTWAEQNPEKAAELQRLRDEFTMTVGGMAGAGGGRGIAHDAIDAIKALRAANIGEDVVLAAERNLAEKSPMTLEEVQKLTRGATPVAAPPAAEEPGSATALTPEEQALNAAADARAQTQPEHAGYLEDPSFGADATPETPAASAEAPSVRSLPETSPPGEAAPVGPYQPLPGETYLPGFEPPKPPKPTAAQARQNTVNDMIDAAKDIYQHGRETFSLDDIDRQAEAILKTKPGTMAELARQALENPADQAAVGGRVLQMNASAAAEAARRAAADVLSAQRSIDKWLAENGINASSTAEDRAAAMKKVPEGLALQAEEAVRTAASLQQDMTEAVGGSSRRLGMAAREMRASQKGVIAARAYKNVQKGKDFFQNLTNEGQSLLDKGADNMTPGDWKRLQNIRDSLSDDNIDTSMLDEVLGGKLKDIEREGIARVQKARGKPAESTVIKTVPPETLAERYGRLARRRDEFRNAGDHEAAGAMQNLLDDTLNDIRSSADERAQKLLGKDIEALSPEEGMKAIQRAIGNKVVNRINKAAMMAQDIREGPDGMLGSMQQWKDVHTLRNAFERSLNRALQTAKNEGIRTDLRKQMSDARFVMERAVQDPEYAPVHQHFQDLLGDLRQQPGAGKNTGERLAEVLQNRYDDLMAEGAFTRQARQEQGVANKIAGYEGKMAENEFTQNARAEQELMRSYLRGIRSQMDEALKNRGAPGAGQRVQELFQNMRDIGSIGAREADTQRERLFRANMLEEGKRMSEPDRAKMMEALVNVRLDDPATLQGVLAAMRNPSLWDKVREGSYISMLSNPHTLETNAWSNLMQILGMLGPHNALSYAWSGGENTGVLAAPQAAYEAIPKGFQMAKEVMRTGMSSGTSERLMGMGDVGALRREYLSEAPGVAGKLGQLYHFLSTRPLEAADQMLGHIAYSAKAAQAAQQKADALLQRGAGEVQGMSRAEAKNYVLQNIWDHPDVMDAAEKTRNYTLMKTRDRNPLENLFRSAAALRDPGLNPTPARMAGAILMDHILPFFNVPLNYGKQGLERTVGVPFFVARGVSRRVRGDRAGAGEDMAKATIGAASMVSAYHLYQNGALTGGGPQDAGLRKVWLENHQPFSVRVGDQWYSYQGTPMAIPFAMVAGWNEASDEAARTGAGDDPASLLMEQFKGGGVGALKGFASQSFLQGLTQQLAFALDPKVALSPGNMSQYAANTALRYGGAAGTYARLPALSGMANFLATMTDGMERDAGRPQTFTEGLTNTGSRIAARLPGLREKVDPRIGAYGEEVRNPRSFQEQPLGLGVIPYYRGRTPQPINDPVTNSLLTVGEGRPPAPGSVALEKLDIPLTIPEQRIYDREFGTMYKNILDIVESDRQKAVAAGDERPVYPKEVYDKFRDEASKYAREMALASVPDDELLRRINAAIEREAAAPQG